MGPKGFLMFTRLRPFFWPARRDTLIGAALLVAAAAAEVMQPWPIKWLVDYVFSSSSPPAWMRGIAPFLNHSHPEASIVFVCGAVISLALALKGLTLLSQIRLIRAGNTLVLQLRSSVCEHLLRLDLAYHDRTKV